MVCKTCKTALCRRCDGGKLIFACRNPACREFGKAQKTMVLVLPQEASVEDAESVEDNIAGNAVKSEIASNA